MNEKAYKTMSFTGISTLVLGIVVMVTGVITGVLLVINGAKLMKDKYEIMI